MKIPIKYTALLIIALCLSACSSTPKDLYAPCPDFGKCCKKSPVNAWEYEK